MGAADAAQGALTARAPGALTSYTGALPSTARPLPSSPHASHRGPLRLLMTGLEAPGQEKRKQRSQQDLSPGSGSLGGRQP